MIPKPVNFNNIYGGTTRNEAGMLQGGIRIPIEQALVLLQTIMVMQPDIIGSDLGLYNVTDNVRNGKVTWGKFNTLGYITGDRPTSCTRTPVRGGSMTTQEINLVGREVFLEFCNDVNINSAWRQFWGAGVDIHDILSTPQGRLFFDKLMEVTLAAISNDFVNASWWSNHPAIAANIDNNTNLTAEYKAQILKTLSTVGGWLATIDALAAEGKAHLSLEINDEDVVGRKYIGDAVNLIKNLEEVASRDFSDVLPYLREGESMYPIVMVTPGIFSRLKQQIALAGANIASGFQLQIDGRVSQELRPDTVGKFSANEFVWDNKIIKNMPAWEKVSRDLKFTQQRAIMTVPKNLGVAIDVAESEAAAGFGLVVENVPGLANVGKIQMLTNYEHATSVIDHNYMTCATSLVFPE